VAGASSNGINPSRGRPRDENESGARRVDIGDPPLTRQSGTEFPKAAIKAQTIKAVRRGVIERVADHRGRIRLDPVGIGRRLFVRERRTEGDKALFRGINFLRSRSRIIWDASEIVDKSPQLGHIFALTQRDGS